MSALPVILPPGSQLGGYLIEDVLGVGGMATVYRARQRSLNRPVALKVLNPRLAADATFRARFQREGALIAALDHPHVVEVFDSGEIDGRLYLAMRLVDGETLADLLGRGGLAGDQALALLRPVAEALDAAHQAGLTHRDVKPQNILVERGGRVFLADFGVARAAGGPDLTVTGGFLGSVSYVAPEQIRGDAAGPAADIYAFSVVLHECLTGRPPFRRDTEAGVMQAHLEEPPPALGPAGDPLAADVADILAAGLAKQPEARPQCAVAMIDAVQAVFAAAPPVRGAQRPAFQVLGAGAAEPAPPARTVTIDEQPPAATTRPRRWPIVLAGIVLLAAAALPAALALRGDEQPTAVAVAGVALTPPSDWEQAPRAADRAPGRLELEGGSEWLQPDGRGTVTVATIAARTALAPAGFPTTTPPSVVKAGAGTLRRWQSGTGRTEQWLAIGATAEGAVMVHCERGTPVAAAACDGVVASLTATGEAALAGDPVAAVATTLSSALQRARTARRRYPLPALDRTRRAARAARVAEAHAAAARDLTELRAARPWDREVVELRAALSDAGAAYAAIASAARRRSRTADRSARAALRRADAAMALAIARLGRRGYRVAS